MSRDDLGLGLGCVGIGVDRGVVIGGWDRASRARRRHRICVSGVFRVWMGVGWYGRS